MNQRSILPVVDWWSLHFFHFSFFALKSLRRKTLIKTEKQMVAVDRDEEVQNLT